MDQQKTSKGKVGMVSENIWENNNNNSKDVKRNKRVERAIARKQELYESMGNKN